MVTEQQHDHLLCCLASSPMSHVTGQKQHAPDGCVDACLEPVPVEEGAVRAAAVKQEYLMAASLELQHCKRRKKEHKCSSKEIKGGHSEYNT
jgi:hypothetical protein